jgi:hypothetical protein
VTLGPHSILAIPLSIFGRIDYPDHSLASRMYVDVPNFDRLLVASPIPFKGLDYGEAARRWTASGRPSSLLLRSPTLDVAEHWIAVRPSGAPEPTAEVLTFVAESRRGARAAQRLRFRPPPELRLRRHWALPFEPAAPAFDLAPRPVHALFASLISWQRVVA